jgi:hypothetical protein
MIALILEPAGPGKFRPLMDGVAISRPTRQPLLDGARALLAQGYPAETIVTTRHAGSATIAMRSTVGEAARWTIKERDRGGLSKERWQPYDADSPPPVAPKTAADPDGEQFPVQATAA